MDPKDKTDGARWEEEIRDLYAGPGEEENEDEDEEGEDEGEEGEEADEDEE